MRCLGLYCSLLFVCAQPVLGQEWREDRTLSLGQEAVAYDLNYNGKTLVGVVTPDTEIAVGRPPVRKKAFFWDLAKGGDGREVHDHAWSVVFDTKPQGGFIVFGFPSTRYKPSGIKDTEIKLGGACMVHDKTGEGHFVVGTAGSNVRTWSFSQRLSWFGPGHADDCVSAAWDGTCLLKWSNQEGILKSYKDVYKNRAVRSSGLVPTPPVDWDWQEGPKKVAVGLDCSKDGKIAAIAFAEEGVFVHFSAEGMTSMADGGVMEGIVKTNSALAVSPKGEYVAVGQTLHSQTAPMGSDTAQVMVWKSGEHPATIGIHKAPVVNMEFLDDTRLVTLAQDGEVVIWNIATGGSQLLSGHGEATKRYGLKPLVISPDRKTLVTVHKVADKQDQFVIFREEKAGTAPPSGKAVTARK